MSKVRKLRSAMDDESNKKYNTDEKDWKDEVDENDHNHESNAKG